MDPITQIIVGLDAVANAVGRWVLAPIAILPGWLSATLVSVVTGVLMLFVFKYTSRQRAIRQVRNGIKAELLALKLFKESARVAIQAQARIVWGAVRLLLLAIVPFLVMIVPISLLLEQLALWYQFRPLHVGEDAVVTVVLNGAANSQTIAVSLEPTSAIQVDVGPVRVPSKKEVCWNVKAVENGYHHLVFRVDGQPAEKTVAVGDGFMRTSLRRPGWDWSDVLSNPAEQPFAANSPVASIDIEYPERSSCTRGPSWWFGYSFGIPWWAAYWFVVSMIAGLCFRRPLHVDI
jgi:hypothetical protein